MLFADLVRLYRVRREIHKAAYPAVQIRDPFSHQASVADRRFFGTPT